MSYPFFASGSGSGPALQGQGQVQNKEFIFLILDLTLLLRSIPVISIPAKEKQMQKYAVNQQLIETLLAWVNSGEIAIPEIQRPFVWDSSKVRDLMDSLYQGYPIGYVIAWRNPNVRLKDGSLSEGKKILIDGQQRVTALTAAILGQYVINKTYERVKIKIAFHPIDERFEVQNPAILTYLRDIR